MNKEYQEKIFSGVLSILAGAAAAFSLGMFAYLLISDSVKDPTIYWTLPLTGLLLTFVAVNFAFLVIKVSPRGITTSYGIFQHTVPADDIAAYYRDEASSLSYGGFGIRFGWKNGKRRLVYNIVNAPCIVIQQRSKPDHEFVFSTKNPEAVMNVLSSMRASK